jgi:type III secretion protein I
MIEQIAALSAAPLTSASIPSTPSALAMERFNAVMNADPMPQSATDPTQSVLQMAFTPPTQGPQTLGSQILSKLQVLSTEYGGMWQNVKNGVDNLSSHFSLSEALRLQANLMHIGVHFELGSKLLARGTQNIDTLVRMS